MADAVRLDLIHVDMASDDDGGTASATAAAPPPVSGDERLDHSLQKRVEAEVKRQLNDQIVKLKTRGAGKQVPDGAVSSAELLVLRLQQQMRAETALQLGEQLEALQIHVQEQHARIDALERKLKHGPAAEDLDRQFLPRLREHHERLTALEKQIELAPPPSAYASQLAVALRTSPFQQRGRGRRMALLGAATPQTRRASLAYPLRGAPPRPGAGSRPWWRTPGTSRR